MTTARHATDGIAMDDVRTNPYSYVTDGGVKNTHVTVADAGTLKSLTNKWKTPKALATTLAEYHSGSKQEKSEVKNLLPYFVGGPINGTRHDARVQSRTWLTLDVEQGQEDDEPPPNPEEVSDRLTALGGQGWIYTTLSNTKASPRYRVLLPLGEPITGTRDEMTAALKASTLSAAKKLGIEAWTKPESWVLSQPMFLPVKLKGGEFWQFVKLHGKRWSVVVQQNGDRPPAPIPEGRPDERLVALKTAGMYLAEKRKGMHTITCPWHDQHSTENDSKTVYYEAHFDGNPRAAVKCMSTSHDTLTIPALDRHLQELGVFTPTGDSAIEAGLLDFDEFKARATVGRYLNAQPDQREWVWQQFAPVGKVTVLGGPGGVSKSMLMLHLLVYGALGKSFAGFDTGGKEVRSLYVSYEDDTLELHRRIYNLANALREMDDGIFDLLYDVDGAIQRNLQLYPAESEAVSWLLLRKPERFSPAERTVRVPWLINYLRREGLKLLVLDPAVYTHQLEENNIADMATYMQTLTAIAQGASVAVVVLHHLSKATAWKSLVDIDQGALRGASSFADNARSVSIMVTMPPADAERYGLPTDSEARSKFAVLKHVKHNYSAPMDTMIFERCKHHLIPRLDLVPLDGVALAAVQKQKNDEKERVLLTQQAEPVLRYVLANPRKSGAQVLFACRIKSKGIGPQILNWLEDGGLIQREAGPRRAKLCMITQDGQEWLADRDPPCTP